MIRGGGGLSLVYATGDFDLPSAAASASLTRGAGANIPDAGVGWTRWLELDVTQNDQSALKASLGYLSTLGFIGTRWTTPDGNGSGAYFDQVVDGRRCMEFRWGAGGTSEGRCALHEFSTVTTYSEMYQRAIVRLTAQEHWPSNGVKLVRTVRDSSGASNGFFNMTSTSGPPPVFPTYWDWTNLVTSNGANEYRAAPNYEPDVADEWFEIEIYTSKNATSSFDGGGWARVGPVGSTVLMTFDELPPGSLTNQTLLSNVQWNAAGIGHGFVDIGPYLGGAPGATLTQDQSIRFATHSYWVK